MLRDWKFWLGLLILSISLLYLLRSCEMPKAAPPVLFDPQGMA